MGCLKSKMTQISFSLVVILNGTRVIEPLYLTQMVPAVSMFVVAAKPAPMLDEGSSVDSRSHEDVCAGEIPNPAVSLSEVTVD